MDSQSTLVSGHSDSEGRCLLIQAGNSAAQVSVLKSVARWSQWRAEAKARKICLQTFKQDKALHQLLGIGVCRKIL